MSEKRVVITGLGTICPVGNDLKTTWQNLLEGKSGLGTITHFDASNQTCTIAAEIKDFDPETVVPKAELKRYDRFSLICLKATDEAWNNAGLHTRSRDRRTASHGSQSFELVRRWTTQGLSFCHPRDDRQFSARQCRHQVWPRGS